MNGLFGIEIKGIVGCNGMNDLGIVKNNKKLLGEAFELGKQLGK